MSPGHRAASARHAGLVQAIQAIRSRRGLRRRRPAKLHADKSYDYPHLRARLASRRITPRVVRRGVGISDRLGRHRWVVERSAHLLQEAGLVRQCSYQ
jgi:hypothetical protein